MGYLLFTQRDGFTDFTPPAEPPEPTDVHFDETAWRRQRGYAQRLFTEGDDNVARVDCWVRAHTQLGEWPRYLVEFSEGSTYNTIFVVEQGDLLALRERLSSLCAANNISCLLPRLVDIAEKAFRAWHRHDSDDACQFCDPLQHKTQQEMRKKAEDKK